MAVGEDDLMARVGAAAVERGRAYAAQGRVRNLTSADGGSVLLAQVQGTGEGPYHVLVTRSGDPWSGRCSCPVRQDCKHVAAVLIAHADGSGEVRVRQPWREALTSLGGGPTSTVELAESALGVMVAVTDVPAPWGARPTRRVLLRPVRQSRAGRWVRLTGWELGSGASELLAPAHRVLLEEMARLDAARTAGFWSGSRGLVSLDDLGTDGWRWLTRAATAGVSLLSDDANRREVVVDLDELAPVVEVRSDPGGLLIRASAKGADDDCRVFPIGSPTHTVVLEPIAIDQPTQVRPVSARAQDVLPLLEAGELIVPAEDVSDFVVDYLPKLREVVTLRSPDGSVDVSGSVRPRLALEISPSPAGGLELRWGVRYPMPGVAGGRGSLLPLAIPFAAGSGRDRDAETALLAQLDVLGLLPRARAQRSGNTVHWLPPGQDRLSPTEAVRFTLDVLPVLLDHDEVDVEEIGDLPAYTRSEDDPEVEIDVDSSGTGVDWFDLTVTVTVGDERVPVASLIAALRRGDDFLVLPSGVWFSLDRPELEQLRALLEEAQHLEDQPSGTVRITRYDLGWFAELERLGVVARQCDAWERVARVVRPDALEFTAPPPDGLRATLRPYQLEGYQWLRALWSAELGGILADDMGLGKTVQTLAAILAAKESGELTEPVLVIAPTSVVGTWASEAARFAPDLDVVTLGRTARVRRRSVEESIAGADLVVTSYAVARIDAAQFAEVTWRALVLDEAHQVKNHQSQTYAAVRRLTRRTTIAVSGTPVENSLMDLWALLSLAAPGMFPKPEDFRAQWRRPIEAGNVQRLAALRRRIRPLLLRRTKDEVALDLPPKQVQVLPVDLAPAHRRLYDRVLLRERQRVMGLLADPEANRIAILASLTRLRQLALDAALVPTAAEEGGAEAAVVGGTPDSLELIEAPMAAKTETLVAHVRELAAEGHRALVFSQFTRYLRRVQRALDAADIDTCYLDGTTSDRARVIEDFRGGSAPVFLISLKAGGVGLTLTEADYVFVLDPWWNPAAEAQAIDRAHRIGQDKPVMVYRMVSAGTIEERVIELQDRKRALASQIVDEDPFTGGLTSADITGLFDPRTA